MVTQKGFGLVMIIIVVAIIAFLIGGRLYFNKLNEQKSTLEIGAEAVKKAEEIKNKIERRNTEEGS